jgi:hypothetical protein
MDAYKIFFFKLLVIVSNEISAISAYSSSNELCLNQDWDYLQKLVEEAPCNIPIELEPISQKEFIDKYAYTSPVVFRHSNNKTPTRNALFKQKCQIDNLLNEYGHKRVTVSTANTHSYNKHTLRLDDYVRMYVLPTENKQGKMKYGNETWYFFGENNYTEWKQLFDLYEMPTYSLPLHEHAYSFGIAGSLSGLRHFFFS